MPMMMERLINIHGVRVKVYSVKYLALALKRKQWTVRSWQRLGYLQKPVLCVPTRGGLTTHRWYTRDEVDLYTMLVEQEVRRGFSIAATNLKHRSALEIIPIKRKYMEMLGMTA